jgi:predicted dehydrogenase
MSKNVGIIGLGAIGERVLRNFQYNEGTRVAALCDTNESRLEELKSELGEIALYSNYKELLNNEEIELVYIAVPPKFHHQIALDAIKKGKHILCEKPLANSIEEAREMAEAAESAGIVNAINFPMMYSNVFRLFKEKAEAGTLGEIKRVEVNLHFTEWPRKWQKNNWIAGREQGGFIREVGPHYIQMILDVFGDIKDVRSFVDYPEDPELCETGFVAVMTAGDNIPVVFNGASGIGQQERISFKIFGEKGTIDLLNWSQLAESTIDAEAETLPVERENDLDLVSEICHSIDGGKARIVSFKQGYKVQEVLEQLLNT